MISSSKLQSGKEARKTLSLKKKKKKTGKAEERVGRSRGGGSLSCQGDQPLTGPPGTSWMRSAESEAFVGSRCAQLCYIPHSWVFWFLNHSRPSFKSFLLWRPVCLGHPHSQPP